MKQRINKKEHLIIDQDKILGKLRQVFDDVSNVVVRKGNEYVPDDQDALANIREIARMTSRTPRDICYILATKHWQSLLRNSRYYNAETMREKRTDIIAYLTYAELLREEELLIELENSIHD